MFRQRNIVLNNWLVNPTGNPFSWVEVDLMQEHMNFWIKVFITLPSFTLSDFFGTDYLPGSRKQRILGMARNGFTLHQCSPLSVYDDYEGPQL